MSANEENEVIGIDADQTTFDIGGLQEPLNEEPLIVFEEDDFVLDGIDQSDDGGVQGIDADQKDLMGGVLDSIDAPVTLGRLERLKLTAELKKLVDQRNGESNRLKRLSLNKKVLDLRLKLGFGAKGVDKGAENTPPQQQTDQTNTQVPQDDQNATTGENEPVLSGGVKTNTSGFFEHHETRTKGARQKDNNAAIALLKQFQNGSRSPESITDAEKAILAKYSGSGGNLVREDGTQGSAYEYYTPKPIAEATWGLLNELGFKGGRVLDPCAGMGIFGATSPSNAVIDAYELDNVSGSINKLVNGGVGHSVTVAPFEEIAANTPEETHDAVVANVPFGKLSDRGANASLDPKYQKDAPEAYFMKRTIDKLKPNGLAAFIVPPRIVSAVNQNAAKLRLQLSLKAEFVGALRLPNKVFGAASADTITDVLLFKKHSKEVALVVEQLYGQNNDALQENNVLWDTFISGKWFNADGKKFVLGKFKAKDPNKWRDVDVVESTESVTGIGKLMRGLNFKSRINLAALNVADVPENTPTYQNGDMMYLDGQALTYVDGQWEALQDDAPLSNEATAVLNLVSKINTPLQALEAGLSYQDIQTALRHLENQSRYKDMPRWAVDLRGGFTAANITDEKMVQAVITGMAAFDVKEAHADEQDANLVDLYPSLAQAMQKYYATKLPSTLSATLRDAAKFVGIHYSRKTKFSDYWQGKRGEIVVNLTAEQELKKAQYINGSLYLHVADAKEIYESKGLSFDPLNDDDWILSADGKTVIAADDFFVGNLASVYAKIDAMLAQTDAPKMRAKYMRLREVALSRCNVPNVMNMKFGLRSPIITPEEKLEWIKKNISQDAVIAIDDNGRPFVDIDSSASGINGKILNRFGDYLKNGTVTLGGIKLDYGQSAEEALTQLEDMVRTHNAAFELWAKSNPAITGRLEALLQDPNNLFFNQVDDGSPMAIDGINKGWTLHPHQNAFIRRMARDFSGINGFDVGLGKTATALAALQHVHNIGVKKKTLIVVPSEVISNWRKEAVLGDGEVGSSNYKPPVYDSDSDCLFVGLSEGKGGKTSFKSANFDRDLNTILENKHRKIFMTIEAFSRLRMREETIEAYKSHLGRVDSSYSMTASNKQNERVQARLQNLLETLASSGASSAPFIEDLGIDSIVFDEAHRFKNSKTTVNFKGGKFLSIGKVAARGIDAQAKVWFVRDSNKMGMNDGVLALTATPITNSPLEVYSMLSLAVGEERVNSNLAGAKGGDDFMEMACRFEQEQEMTVDLKYKSYRTFVGLQNGAMLRNLLHSSAVIKTADDVGQDIEQPDAEEMQTAIKLPKDIQDRLVEYKVAYGVAALMEKNKKGGAPVTFGVDMDDYAVYEKVLERSGKEASVLASAFNLINTMSNVILDPDLDDDVTCYTFKDATKGQSVCDAFNKLNFKAVVSSVKGDFPESDIVKKTPVYFNDGTGKGEVRGYDYTIKVTAKMVGKRLILNTSDFKAAIKLDEMIEKQGADVDMDMPPKIAALIDNMKSEMASPRGIDGLKRTQKSVKQIVFCDSLGMHVKLRRLIAKHCNIPLAKVTFISGVYNGEAEALLDVQAGFNAPDEENVYQVIIGNKKAEVGINLQKGTQAVHHLTIGWTPDSIQQRNGRAVRQGNKTAVVTVYYYDADGTFDVYRRRLVNKKSEWIGQLLSKDENASEVDIQNELTQEQKEALINLIGNDVGMEKFQSDMDAQEFASRKRATRAKQEVALSAYTKATKDLEKLIERGKPFSVESGDYSDEKTIAYAVRLFEDAMQQGKILAKYNKAYYAEMDKSGHDSPKSDQWFDRVNMLESQLIQDVTLIYSGVIPTFASVDINDEKHTPEELAKSIVKRWKNDDGWYSNYRPSVLTDGFKGSDVAKRYAAEVQVTKNLRVASKNELQQSLTNTGSYSEESLNAVMDLGFKIRAGDEYAAEGDIIQFDHAKLLEAGRTRRGNSDLVNYSFLAYGLVMRPENVSGNARVSVYAPVMKSGYDDFVLLYGEETKKDSDSEVYEKAVVKIIRAGTDEAQAVLAQVAQLDIDRVKNATDKGLFTGNMKRELLSNKLPELQNFYPEEVTNAEVSFIYTASAVLFQDKTGLFPKLLFNQDDTLLAGDYAQRWRDLKAAQLAYPSIVKFELGRIVCRDEDTLQSAMGRGHSASLRQGMVAHNIKACSFDHFDSMVDNYIEFLPYDSTMYSRYASRIEEAQSLADAKEALQEFWLGSGGSVGYCLTHFIDNMPSDAIEGIKMLKKEGVTNKASSNSYVGACEVLLLKYEMQELKFKEPTGEDIFVLKGDTRSAFKTIPFRDVAKQVTGGRIAWRSGKKMKMNDDSELFAMSGTELNVWVFNRPVWEHIQANYANEVQEYDLTVERVK